MFKTIGIAALASIVALIVGFGGHGSSTTPTAHADTTGVVVVGCELIAGAVDGVTTNTITDADVQAACGGSATIGGPSTALPATGTRSIKSLANAIGDEDGVLEQSDFAAIEGLDGGNQISTDCHFGGGTGLLDFAVGMACTLDVFVFVNHEAPVALNLPAGLASLESPTTEDFTCNTEATIPFTTAATITGVDLAGTFTTSAAHGLVVGDVITVSAIAGAVPAIPAGTTFTIATAPTTTTFTTTPAVTLTTAGTTGTIVTLTPLANPTLGQDNDCSGAPPTGFPNNGDGVVMFHIQEGNAARGSVLTVSVSQDAVAQSFDVNTVGPANNVALTLVENVIETNGNSANVTDCITNTDVTDAIKPPTSTLAFAIVTDQDNTKLARVPVTLKVTPPEATEIARLGIGDVTEEVTSDTFFSVQPSDSSLPAALYRVICGGKNHGKATIDASINLISCALTGCTILSSTDHDTKDITVGGAPSTNVLTAEASTIKCDGTEKSTVTAKVTDSDGNNVADGVPVNFSVVALGTANPINTVTKAGVATSVITPLSNSSAGTTVIVTAGDSLPSGNRLPIATVVQTSVRVDCALPLETQPTLTPPNSNANPTPRGGIGGPDTGNGGYLGQNSSNSFPMWALIALALGSVTLVAGGLVTRRAGK